MLKYDKCGRLARFSEKAGGAAHKTDYVYDKDDRTTEIAYDGTTHTVKYTYDKLGRIQTRTAENGAAANNLTSEYSYVAGGSAYDANATTPLVARIAHKKGSGDTAPVVKQFDYAYDSRGNIVSENQNVGNPSVGLVTTYVYDALGQLIRVNDPHENATWVYNHDLGGNITSKVKYDFTVGALNNPVQTIPYDYEDASWKDKLTAYNGQAISYDAIGNPLNDGTWSYAWGAGRQLRQMSKTGTTIQFKYDHNGLRTQKIVTENGVTTTTNYTLHGKLITHMTRGTDSLHFFYDAQSRPAKVNFNGTMYTYLHNLQGDIVGILDNNGAMVVEYKYDAWGKPTGTWSATGSTSTLTTEYAKLLLVNPFRYRGYVFDEETGLYYLRSRYYVPEWGRFENIDQALYGSFTVLSLNLFSYCKNDSSNEFDPDGKSPLAVAGLYTLSIIVLAFAVEKVSG